MTTPTLPAAEPPYRTQLPTRDRAAEARMDGFTPQWSIQMVTGLTTTKVNKKPVESQLMADSLVA